MIWQVKKNYQPNYVLTQVIQEIQLHQPLAQRCQLLVYSKVKFTLKQSIPDDRDHVYTPVSSTVRDKVDHRKLNSSVDDQYELGSCSANALVNAYEMILKQKYPNKFIDLSRLFVYYNTRFQDGTTEIDSGAYIRDTIKATKIYGLCTEKLWPYIESNLTVRPTEECYVDAKTRNIKDYKKIIKIEHMMDALNNNIPVVFGMPIYHGFYYVDKRNPVIRVPYTLEPSLGGHAMVLVGYDKTKELFIAKNSFGVDWGEDGYCYIPFEYARKLFYDCWVFDIVLN